MYYGYQGFFVKSYLKVRGTPRLHLRALQIKVAYDLRKKNPFILIISRNPRAIIFKSKI